MKITILKKSLITNLPALLLATIMIFFPNLSFSFQEEFTVFLAEIQTSSTPEGDPNFTKNLYINGGEVNGLKESAILDVYRSKTVRDTDNGQDYAIKVHVGQIKIVSLHNDISITRIVGLASNKDTHLLRYRTVMTGDLAVPRKEDDTIKGDDIVPGLGQGITLSGSGVQIPSHILFDLADWKLKPEALEILSNVYDTFNQSKDKDIIIEGHSCSLGSGKFNLELSKKRAQSVSEYLKESKGIPADLIRIEYYGENNPIASNDTKLGRMKNRRVEIRFQESEAEESSEAI